MSELLRFIGADGVEDRPLPVDLSEEGALAIYRSMVLLRTFDERAVALQRQGRIGTYPLFWGEEATQAGPFAALASRDWVFPSYRQSAIAVLRGLPPVSIYRYRRGFGGNQGFWDPREYRVAPIAISIATHLPHAVGLAWAAQRSGEELVSLVWFGDGATSEGDFHEAMNLAGVWRTPTVFFCINNGWAISTPFHKQTATSTVAEKAEAYGMPSRRVDGFDPYACWEGARSAVARAREGGGPTLVEAYCYRLGPHGTADDPGRYRDEAVTEKWKELEPVGRTSGYLKRLGVLSDRDEETIFGEARAAIATAVGELNDSEPPSTDVLFQNVYAGDEPWSFEESRVELSAVERDG